MIEKGPPGLLRFPRFNTATVQCWGRELDCVQLWKIRGPQASKLLLPFAGDACSIVALDEGGGGISQDDVAMRDELSTQHLRPAQRFLVASTAGQACCCMV